MLMMALTLIHHLAIAVILIFGLMAAYFEEASAHYLIIDSTQDDTT